MTQGTPEWHAARLGKVTASRLVDVLANVKSGEAAARANYRAELVAERLTGKHADGFINAAMKWGTEAEPLARAAYEAEFGLLVQEVGLIDHPSIPMTGASPDGLVSIDGLIEIKCPETKAHIDTLLRKAAPEQYIPQMQWQMACTGRAWVDFVSFDDRLPEPLQYARRRFHFDVARVQEMETEIRKFLVELADLEAEMRQRMAA